MALSDLSFDRKISIGNIIEICILIAGLVWATAFVKADVEQTKRDGNSLRNELRIHIEENREQVRINDATYVRKDVFDQVMKRLDDIQTSINRLDQKVSQ